MKTQHIPQTDLTVSRLAYGCGHLSQPKFAGFEGHLEPNDFAEILAKRKDALKASFAQWKNAPADSTDIANGVRLVRTAHDSGINLFDHADIYGWGKCEAVFGEALRQTPGLREKIVIQSKCGIRFADDFLEPQSGDPHRMDFSYEHILRSVEGTLQRLGTDRLDILLLHRPDALMEPEEVARAFDELHRSGKVRYFGVSNHTAAQIDLLKQYIHQPLVVNQLHVSLAHSFLIADALEANREHSTRITREYTGVAGTLDYCRRHRIQVQAWSPLKGGNNAPHLLNPPPGAPPQVIQAAKMLVELAKRKNATPSAIALAWILRHPAGIIPIIGTTNPTHLVDNCAADRVTLSREEWYELFVAAAGVPSMQLLGISIPHNNAPAAG